MFRQALTIDAGGTILSVTVETSHEVVVQHQLDPIPGRPGSWTVQVSLETEPAAPFDLHDLAFAWSTPILDMHGIYFGGNPREEMAYLPFWWVEKIVSANSGVPFLSLFSRTSENRFAFGLADQRTETRLYAHMAETTRTYDFVVQKPMSRKGKAGPVRVESRWEETLFLSTRPALWPEVIADYTHLVDCVSGEPLLPVPDSAYAPVYCSWYAVHHDVSDEWARRQAAIAADLGFGTWLTDDGWFVDGGTFADYSRVGDWEPYAAKFPDFREHVRFIQALGLRYLIWVSPFMVGSASASYQRNRDLLIAGQEREKFDNLSPCKPETRQIVTDLLVGLVRDYGLDGLKIDFIDSVKNPGGDDAEANGVNFGECIYRILAEAVDAMAEIVPDLLIEFRNSYSNLASRRYANLYRSSDVPFNTTLNRWQAVLLRLLTPDRAVQLDPVIWNADETDEAVAVQLINTIVSVPTISIDLGQYPASHLDLLRYWLGFYNDHRNALVHGDMRPELQMGHVPVIWFSSETESIGMLFEDVSLALDAAPRLWLLNASTRPGIDLRTGALAGPCQVIERDKFGRIVSDREICFPQARLDVEIGGSLEITGL